jgi:hypothetical protein
MNLSFFKRIKRENAGKNRVDKEGVKCKYCEMGFENNERLKIHSRIAHTGRREKEKRLWKLIYFNSSSIV